MPDRSSSSKFFTLNSKGSVSIFFGIATLVLMAMIGLAIDTARYYNLSSKMQDALDAAVLTGAKLLPNGKSSNSDISRIVKANFNAAIKKAGVKTIYVAPLSVNIDRAQSTVSAVSRVQVRSFFGPIINQPRQTRIVRDTKVVYEINKIELAMVLDITGSMNAKNKIADLKSAANDIIDELFGSAVTNDSVRIAIAPYSASVNAGSLANAVSQSPPTETCATSWFKGIGCKTSSGIDLDTCVIERTGAHATTEAAPVGLDKLPSVTVLPYGNYSCPSATVVPLLGRDDSATLKSIVSGYKASGSTAGHIGTAWGWYLLSPDWAGVLPAKSKPEPYESENLNKSIIVMTDGLFNSSYINGKSTPAATQTDESYAQFKALCDGAKGKGITIYTVGFDLQDIRAKNELENCASASANFFDAKTGAELKNAFKEIASKLNRLRVAS